MVFSVRFDEQNVDNVTFIKLFDIINVLTHRIFLTITWCLFEKKVSKHACYSKQYVEGPSSGFSLQTCHFCCVLLGNSHDVITSLNLLRNKRFGWSHEHNFPLWIPP